MGEVALPPYNGFGDNADSIENCKHLVPKPPKKDFHKAMNNAPQGTNMNMLRFNASIEVDSPLNQNAERKFIVRYFLSDDTVEVFEPPVRNSGILGGKFMKRCKVHTPEGAVLQPTDLVKGSVAQFSQTNFIIQGADEYTLKFLDTDGNGVLSREELAVVS